MRLELEHVYRVLGQAKERVLTAGADDLSPLEPAIAAYCLNVAERHAGDGDWHPASYSYDGEGHVETLFDDKDWAGSVSNWLSSDAVDHTLALARAVTVAVRSMGQLSGW